MGKLRILKVLLLLLYTAMFNNLNAQIKYDSTNCSNTGTFASAIGYKSKALNNYCFSSGNGSIASGYASTAIGTDVKALGPYSISLGLGSESSMDYSFSFGWQTKANSTESVNIGSFNRTTASGGITIGTSNANAVLLNDKLSSLMIGFNSTFPTLFISPSEDNIYHNGTGRVGIATVYPAAKLHVQGDSYFHEDMMIGSDFSRANLYVHSLKSVGRQVVVADKNGMLSLIDDGQVPGDNLGNHIATLDIILSDYGLKYAKENLSAINLNKDNQIFLNSSVFIGSSTNQNTTSIYGKVGINKDNPLAEFEVQGTVSIGYNTHTIPGTNGLIVNGAVGIGTFSPTEALEIVGKVKTNQLQISDGYMNGYILTSDPVGNATWVDPNSLNTGPWLRNGDMVYVDQYKKVGIGIETPQEALDVLGNLRMRGDIKGARTNTFPLKVFGGSTENDGAYITLCNNIGLNGSLKMYANGPTSRIEFFVNDFKAIDIRSDKNIVFGYPNEYGEGDVNICVNGEVNANLMRVQVDGWWDCVFDDNYELQSLADVEKYIEENGHLPDIPSEAEVLKDGINVAEMNALLLKKVEELTLYVIELQKKVDNLTK